jgi:hypothetical protein
MQEATPAVTCALVEEGGLHLMLEQTFLQGARTLLHDI